MKNLRPQITLSNGHAGFRTLLAAEVRVLSAKDGLVEYVASDETIDSYREIVRVDGWRFDQFAKNSPFVNTHDYSDIRNLLGKVLDWKVDKRNRRLIETVQWAIDAELPEDHPVNIGWKLTQAGYLKAVSVGFWPVKYYSRWDQNPTGFHQQLNDLGIEDKEQVRCIYTEQQQIELSACVIGANPNALQMAAKAYKAGVLTDAQLETISTELSLREPVPATADPADVAATRRQAREKFLGQLQTTINKIK